MPYYIRRKPKTKEDGTIDWSAYDKPRKPLKPVSDKKKAQMEQAKAEGKKPARTQGKAVKTKVPSRSTLIKKLDRVFSQYIRLRDSREFGGKYFRCISCGQLKPFSQGDAGHFYSRTKMSVRYDEENVNFECKFCNRFSADHLIGYREHLIRRIGAQHFTLLQVRASQSKKWECWELEQLIKYYSALAKKIQEDLDGAINAGGQFG